MPGLFGLAVGYASCNRWLAVSMVILSLGCKGAFYSGLKVNHLDISTNYAGMVNAIVNALGAISGFVTPYIDEAITKNVGYIHKSFVIFILLFLITAHRW